MIYYPIVLSPLQNHLNGTLGQWDNGTKRMNFLYFSFIRSSFCQNTIIFAVIIIKHTHNAYFKRRNDP